MSQKKHVLSVLVDNEPGVLSRIAGLFSGRGFNIESLNVAETLDPCVSRATIVTAAAPNLLEQVMKQLNKLINIIKVQEMTAGGFVNREMALIKLYARPDNRAEILRIADIFRCRVVDVGKEHYTLEVTGAEDKLEAILNLLKPFGIREIARTGTIAMARDPK